MVRYGNIEREEGGFTVEIQQLFVHPNYIYLRNNYDIGLILTMTPMNLDGTIVSAIPLAMEDLEPEGNLTVSGWGWMHKNVHKLADWLQVMTVPILNRTECEEDYDKMSIDDGMFCAGYESGEIDACHGDSGGPGTGYDVGTELKLLGIVSWGDECAEPYKPGVYVKVSYFIQWINETIENNTNLILR